MINKIKYTALVKEHVDKMYLVVKTEQICVDITRDGESIFEYGEGEKRYMNSRGLYTRITLSDGKVIWLSSKGEECFWCREDLDFAYSQIKL